MSGYFDKEAMNWLQPREARGRRGRAFAVVSLVVLGWLAAVYCRVEIAEAKDSGPVEIIQEALDRGEDLNALIPVDESVKIRPLHMILGEGEENLKAARMLLKAGADPNAPSSLGSTPLHMAAETGSPRFAALLIEFGADVNARDPQGRTPLHVLGDFAATLTGLGPTQPSQTRDRKTRLVEMAKALLNAGADPNARDDRQQTPLHTAAEIGSRDLVEELLKAGADPQRENKRGLTPLENAALYGSSPDVLEPLIRAGADVEAVALTDVLDTGRVEVARILVANGASLKKRDDLSRTPLHVLAIRGQGQAAADLARLMLNKGADREAVDGFGKKPVDYAEDPLVRAVLMGAEREKASTQAASRGGGSQQASGSATVRPAEGPDSRGPSTGVSNQQNQDDFKRVVDTVMNDVSALYKEQDALIDRAAEAGDLARLSSAEEIPGKIALIQRYRDVCRRLEHVLSDPRSLTQKTGHNLGMSSPEIEKAVGVLKRSFDSPEVALELKKLRAEIRWAEAVIKGLALLRDNPQKWSPQDAPNGAPISLTDRSFADPFSKVAAEIRKAEAATNAVNAEYRKVR